MTIRTGKSGRYRYYACSIKARQGETGCKGRAIPMDKLDTMVSTTSKIDYSILNGLRISLAAFSAAARNRLSGASSTLMNWSDEPQNRNCV